MSTTINLLPSDKIAVTLIQQLLKKKKTEQQILDFLIKQNQPFIDRHYRYTFVKKSMHYISIAQQLNQGSLTTNTIEPKKTIQQRFTPTLTVKK